MHKAFLLLALLSVAIAKVYFSETFSDGDAWASRWIASTVNEKEKPRGKFTLTAGKWYGDKQKAVGIQTSEDARFYIFSSAMEEFSTVGMKKPLYIQYTVKHEQEIDCGGAYIKLLPKDAFSSQSDFHPDSQYNIMFGPDICGATKRIHVIFSHNDTNHLTKHEVAAPKDRLTHIYTLGVFPNNTYSVDIDGTVEHRGSLEEDFDMVKPKQIPDPKASKPEDWVDAKEIDDPEDKKPADWDDEPKRIPDPKAKRPDDWDDENDGVWEAPTIENPKYKGEWKAKQIPNPAYKGPWEHPMIDNPEYVANDHLFEYESFKYVGIEIWQVKSGTIFDNFLITDEEEKANAGISAWKELTEAEKKMKETVVSELEKTEKAKVKEVKTGKEDDEDDDDSDDESDSDSDAKKPKKKEPKEEPKKEL